MNTATNQNRRWFLKSTIIASAALTFSLTALAQPLQASSAAPQSGGMTATTQQIRITYRSNLYDIPKSIELPLGSWSSPIQTKGKGTYLVKVIQVDHAVDSRLGPVFTLILADPSGKELSQINLGNGATGTFTDYGLEFNLTIDRT